MTARSETGVMVVKVGGAAIESPLHCEPLWAALARIHDSDVARIVLVHGGGAAVDRRLGSLGLQSQRREGIRITPPEHIDHVVEVLAGSTNLSLVSSLRRHGAKAVGLTLADGGTSTATKTTRYAFDPGCVGEITGGDSRLLQLLLVAGFLPVLSSIALDEAGRPLNVNADDAAAGIAAILDARDLVLLTDVPGVRDAGGALIPDLNVDEITRLIETGVIHGGMIVKVRAAAEAAQRSGRSVIIASWDRSEDIERLARGERAGTRVHPTGMRSPDLAFRSELPSSARRA